MGSGFASCFPTSRNCCVSSGCGVSTATVTPRVLPPNRSVSVCVGCLINFRPKRRRPLLDFVAWDSINLWKIIPPLVLFPHFHGSRKRRVLAFVKSLCCFRSTLVDFFRACLRIFSRPCPKRAHTPHVIELVNEIVITHRYRLVWLLRLSRADSQQPLVDLALQYLVSHLRPNRLRPH